MSNLAKSTPAALLNAASKHLKKGQFIESEYCVMEALKRNTADHRALAQLAEVYAAQGLNKEAFSYYTLAICADPSVEKYKKRFIQIVNSLTIDQYGEETERAIVECLKSADVIDCSALRKMWVSHLISTPEFDAAFSLEGRSAFEPANKVFFESLTNFKPLFRPSFLLGVKNFVVYNPIFEEFITHLRKHLLADHGIGKKFTAEESVALSAALAHYAFNGDYILDVTEEEQIKVNELRANIEADKKDANDAASVALLGSYMLLHKLLNKSRIAERFAAHSDIGDVVQVQISDYDAMRAIAPTIEAITPIDNAVSLKVREQYEEFPYPRWKAMMDTSLLNGWKMEGNNHEITNILRGKTTKILVAGCGTGTESVTFAATFPHAKILAVDLSLSSLSYAIHKVRELNLKNITFKQADILRLGELDQKFDCIVSGGVLHHIQDPVKAWGILRDLLKPKGIMMIALYSKIARRNVLKGQEVVKRENFSSDADSMRAFRKKSPDLLEKHALDEIASFADYYYLNMYRDMLFHVQEHDYDLPEIENILGQLKLDFSGFIAQPEVFKHFEKMFPDARDHMDIEKWHRFESVYTDVFKSMYTFWCRKKNQE